MARARGGRKSSFVFGEETGFFGGADADAGILLEENILGYGNVYAAGNIEDVFESASLKQDSSKTGVMQENSTIKEREGLFLQSNPNNPNYDNSEELREEIVKYKISAGDTISGIAEKFGISPETILWANDLNEAGIIKPGQELDILPVSGVKHKTKKGDTAESIAKKYKASAAEVTFFNGIGAESVLEAGTDIIVPGGELPDAIFAKKIEPKKAIAAPKDIKTAGQGNGFFIHPAAGHNWGRTHAHNGIDISNPKGGPIYAAAQGTIILADGIGYNGGYGKYVQIKHLNGVITLYAHLSKIIVSEGQVVRQGAVIGMMGNTGRSTGTHLHFEVRGARNPLARY